MCSSDSLIDSLLTPFHKADPELTLIGKGQANIAHDAWAIELPFGIPIPSKLISSPLTRAMQTLQITFNGILGLGTNSRKETIVVVEVCVPPDAPHQVFDIG